MKDFRGFDPATRRTGATVSINGEDIIVTKGAVETILILCGNQDNGSLKEKEEEIGSRDHRIMAVAVSKDRGYRFVGLVGLSDSPRPDTRESVRELKSLGINIKTLTGDAEPIAKEISKEIGLGERVVTGSNLEELKVKDPVTAANIAEESDIFAEIYLEDKYTIVKGLQENEHIVGMTGDGINDAPALKRAEVGIAVSNATDVAKGAANVILTTEGLRNIVDLLKTGRTTYQRIVTWVLNKIVKIFQVAVFLTLGFIVTGYYLLSALDIILFLFLIDFVTIFLSTDSMHGSKKPEKWDIRNLVKIGISVGAIQVVEMFILLFVEIRYFDLGNNIGVMNTFFFTEIMFFGLLTPIIVSEKDFFWKSAPGRTLMISIIGDMVVVSILSLFGFGIVAPVTLIVFVFILSYGLFMNLLVNDVLQGTAQEVRTVQIKLNSSLNPSF